MPARPRRARRIQRRLSCPLNRQEPVVTKKRHMISVEAAKSSLRVAVAHVAATGLIMGFDDAAEEGRPLGQLQKIHLVEMSMMAVASTIEAHEETLDFEAVVIEGIIAEAGSKP